MNREGIVRVTATLHAHREPTRREAELLRRVADRAVAKLWDQWREEDKPTTQAGDVR